MNDKSLLLDEVVTNAWNRIGYNIVRSLGRRGLKVGVGVDENSGMGAFSRFATVRFRHASYLNDEVKFIEDTIKIIKKYRPSVFIPSDEEIFTVAKYIDNFRHVPINIPISPLETLLKLHNKKESHELAKSLGIPVPQTITPKSISDIKVFARQYGFPIVMKQQCGSSARGVFYIHEKNFQHALEKTIQSNKLDFGKFVIQQYVKGTGYGVSMLFNKGQLKAHFTHRRLREQIDTGGPSTLREGVVNEPLEEFAQLLLSSVKYHGVAMVEFKVNENINKAWFIEVNPRFWGSLALAIKSGVDFPYLLYKIASEGDVKSVPAYKTGVKCKWLLGDLFNAASTLYSRKNLRSFKQIFERVDEFDDLHMDEFVPFFISQYLHLKRLLKIKYQHLRH